MPLGYSSKSLNIVKIYFEGYIEESKKCSKLVQEGDYCNWQ